MSKGEIKRRDRVLCTLRHEQPDRTPADFQAVGEIWQAVYQHFGTQDPQVVLDALDIDVAWVDPEVNREPTLTDDDGLLIGWGGSRLKKVYNEYGAYDEVIRYATQGAMTPEEIDAALALPDLDRWDFESVKQACKKYSDRFLIGGFASIFYYPTLVRSMEDLLTDMALNPPLATHLLKRCFDWHMDYHTRLLKAGSGRIDAMQLADDFSSQLGPLISISMFRDYFREPMCAYIELAKSYGAVPFLHCCGSPYNFIAEFLDMGVKILDPVQTRARDMEPERLKAEFGSRLTFHGGGETQGILPHGTAEDARQNARYLCKTLGARGGYILSSCHFWQADVPLQNILAFYEIRNR